MYDGTTDLTDVTSPLARTISQLNPAGGVLNANANGNYYVLYLFPYKTLLFLIYFVLCIKF